MLGWVKLGHLVVALSILLRIFQLSGFAMDHKISESDNPLPKHFLSLPIKRGTKRIEDARSTLSVKSTTVVLLKLNLHLPLKNSILLYDLGVFPLLLILRVFIFILILYWLRIILFFVRIL